VRRSHYNGPVETATTAGAHRYSPSVDNLRNLLLIRGIALLGQTGVLGYATLYHRGEGDLAGAAASIALLAAVTVASLWRTTRQWPVEDREFLAQLIIDVLGWSALMYFTGGANNPFISYYIVPVVVAAAVLPWRHTWLVAGASLLAYSLLLYVYRPFPLFAPHGGMDHGDGANLHIVGMWFNFLFSVGLITYFVVRMATILRRREAEAVARREDGLRNDQILAVASLAAGTAHELGTPLSTMTVLVDEMLEGEGLDEGARADCRLLQEQLAQCRATLSELSRTAQLSSATERVREPAGEFARRTLERWSVRRPGTAYRLDCPPDSPVIDTDTTLAQALENLLNNAADTGSEEVVLALDWDARALHLRILDRGPGVDPAVAERIGRPVIRADRSGLGIGLMLTQATVERYGGSIELRAREGGGTRATLTLPLTGGDADG